MDDNSPTFNFAENNFQLGYTILGTKGELLIDDASKSGSLKLSYESITHLFTDDYIDVRFVSLNFTKEEGIKFKLTEKKPCNLDLNDDYAFIKNGSICSNPK